MKTQKTPVLLAFGDHGNSRLSLGISPDKRFFRNSVAPFLKEHVEKRGGRAAIIHEALLTKSIFGKEPSNEQKLSLLSLEGRARQSKDAQFQEALSSQEAKLNKMLLIRESSRLIADWGFCGYAQGLKISMPGSILEVVEPQLAQYV